MRSDATGDEEMLGGDLGCLRNAGNSNLRDDGAGLCFPRPNNIVELVWGLPTHGNSHSNTATGLAALTHRRPDYWGW